MPRLLPPLAADFDKEVARAINLVERVEKARIALQSDIKNKKLLHYSNIETLHEFAYLRVFLAWEAFLEQTFFRYLCGYRNTVGQETIRNPSYCATLTDAENAVLGERDYVLWHNPQKVVSRAQTFFVRGRHEQVIRSNQARLELFAKVRHRIAHSQRHAKGQFDLASMALCGKRYSGSRPGRFLRDQLPTVSPPRSWLYEISTELVGLAFQIGP